MQISIDGQWLQEGNTLAIFHTGTKGDTAQVTAAFGRHVCPGLACVGGFIRLEHPIRAWLARAGGPHLISSGARAIGLVVDQA
jgi:hypothetical protein